MRIKQFLIAVGVGTMLAACSSKEDYTTEVERIPIRINASIEGHLAGTRAVENSAKLHGTSFVNGEQFYVNVYYSDTKKPISPCSPGIYGGISDCEYNNGAIILEDVYYPHDLSAAFDVISFFPDNVDGTTYIAGDGGFYVQKDQSTDEKYRLSDFMFASAEGHVPFETIDLNFKHLMSKVIVNLSGYDSDLIENYSVYIKDVQTKTELANEGTKNVSIAETLDENKDIADIKMGNYADAGVTAIVIPQTINSGRLLFVVKIGISEYEYITDSPITFESGHVYTFNLNFDNETITTGTISIAPWTGKDAMDHNYNGTLQ